MDKNSNISWFLKRITEQPEGFAQDILSSVFDPGREGSTPVQYLSDCVEEMLEQDGVCESSWAGAIHLFEELEASYFDVLDPNEQAVVLGALAKALDGLGRKQNLAHHFRRGALLYFKAGELLTASGYQSPLRCQFFKLAGEMFYKTFRAEKLEEDRSAALARFREAFTGDIYRYPSPQGLYFNCATMIWELFRERPDDLKQYLEPIVEELAGAWTCLPGVAAETDNPDWTIPSQCLQQQLPDSATALITNCDLLIADRLGVCFLLTHADPDHSPWLYEGVVLAQTLRTSNFLDGENWKHAKEMVDWFIAQKIDLAAARKAFLSQKEAVLAQELGNLLRAGRLKELSERCQEARSKSKATLNIALLQAHAIGCSTSAKTELDVLREQIPICTTPGDLARLHYHIAFALANGGEPEEALRHAEVALRKSGHAKSLLLIMACQSLRHMILDELWSRDLCARIKSFTLYQQQLWSKPSWAFDSLLDTTIYAPGFGTYEYEDELYGLRESLHEGIYSGQNGLTKKDRLEYLACLESTSSENAVVLAQCWAIFLQRSRAKHLDEQLQKHLLALLSSLKSLRAFRAAKRLASELQKQPSSSEIRRKLIEIRLDLELTELNSTKRRRYRHAIRCRIRELLVEWLRESGATIDPCSFVRYCDALMTIDWSGDSDEGDTSDVMEASYGLELDRLTESLRSSGAALVTFFIYKNTAVAGVVSDAGATVHTLRLTNLKDLKNKIRKTIYDFTRSPVGNIFEGLGKLMDESRRLRPGKARSFEECCKKVWSQLCEIGRMVWPQSVTQAIQDAKLVYVVPGRELADLPLLALPTERGSALLSSKPCCRLPRAELLHVGSAVDKELDRFVYVDQVSPTDASRFLNNFDADENSWNTTMGPCVLEAISRHKQSWLYLHGIHDRDNPYLSRLFTANGGFISAGSILTGPYSFDGCELNLFACWGATAIVNKKHEFLGLANACLERGAQSVLGSAWLLPTQLAADFACLYFKHRSRMSRAEAFHECWKAHEKENDPCGFVGWLSRASLQLLGRA